MKSWKWIAVVCMMAVGLSACSPEIDYLAYEPQETVKEFFRGVETKDEQVLAKYIENDMINLLLNTRGSEKQKDRLYENLFENLDYKIISVKTNEEKVTSTIEVEVVNHNFKKAFDRYADEAYEYLEGKLYNNDLTKKELNRKCFRLFVDQVADIASDGKDRTRTVKIKLKSNGNYGWQMELSDELIRAVTGNLTIPVI